MASSTIRPHGLDEYRRLEDQAAGLKELMYGDIIHAPLSDPRLILDVGCGTGIVTREIGRLYPSATVIGVNTSPVPSSTDTPANVKFIQGDFHELFKSDKRISHGTFDYIFSRLLIINMTDWEVYVREVASLLKPGGWFEVQDTTYVVYQHGEDISDTWKWSNLAVGGARQLWLEPLCGEYAARWMENSGLDDVQVAEFVMPSGTWNVKYHPESRRIGEHMARHQGMIHRQLLPKFVKIFHMSEDEVENLRDQCVQDLKAEEGKHRIFYVTIGRKSS